MTWSSDISMGNVVSWALILGSGLSAFVWVQADVAAIKHEIEVINARSNKAETRIETIRDEISSMAGDLRVMNQRFSMYADGYNFKGGSK